MLEASIKLVELGVRAERDGFNLDLLPGGHGDQDQSFSRMPVSRQVARVLMTLKATASP
jgi:hypothetical protein